MVQKIKNQEMLASGIALAGVVLFSSKSVFAKMAYEHNVSPVTVIYLRMVIALPVIAIIGLLYEFKHRAEKINWRDVFQVFLISLLGYYISSLLNFVGLLYVEAAIERLILFLYPTMVIILSTIFFKKKISLYQVLAIGLSYVGLLLAFADKLVLNNTGMFWYGAILIVLSSLSYAIFLVLSDGLIARLGSTRFTTIAILSMSAGIIVHAMLTGKAHIYGYPAPVYINCGLMAILSTVVPVYMFNYAIEKLGSSNVSIISCAGPICTLMYSAVLLSDRITIFQVLGTLVVMGAILYMYYCKKQEVFVEKK